MSNIQNHKLDTTLCMALFLSLGIQTLHASTPCYAEKAAVTIQADQLVWQELQPAGDSSQAWKSSDSCYTGQKSFIGGTRLYVSYDHGSSWDELRPAGDTNGTWTILECSFDASIVMAGNYNGRLWTSSNGGGTWTQRQPAGDTNLQWNCGDVSANGLTMIAGVEKGRLYHSTDGGSSWVELQPTGDQDEPWQFCKVSDDGQIFLAGAFPGKLYTSTDGGTTWTEHEPAGPGKKPWNCGAMNTNGMLLLACANGGRTYLSKNQGLSWEEIQPAGGTNKNWKNATMSDDGQIMAVAANPGRLFVTTDSGTAWTEIQPEGDATHSWSGLSCSANGLHFIAPIDNGRAYRSSTASLASVATVTTTQITMTEATSGGNVTNDGGAEITKRGVCWNTAGIPTISDNITTNGTGTGTYSSQLTNLSPGTTYFVRAYAINNGGTSYGCQDVFTTLTSLPTVSTTVVTDITTTDATGGGTITSDGGSAITERGVCWNFSGTPTTADFRTVNGSGIGTYSSNLTNLNPGTHYYVRAYATSSAGTAYGNQKSFITAETTPEEDIDDGDGEATESNDTEQAPAHDTSFVDEDGYAKVQIDEAFAIVENAQAGTQVILDIDPGTEKPTVTVLNSTEDILVELSIAEAEPGSGFTIKFNQGNGTRISVTDPDGTVVSNFAYSGDRIPDQPVFTLHINENGRHVYQLGSVTISQLFEIIIEEENSSNPPQTELTLSNNIITIIYDSKNETAEIIISGPRSEIARHAYFTRRSNGDLETSFACNNGISLGLNFAKTFTNPYCEIQTTLTNLINLELESDNPSVPDLHIEYNRSNTSVAFTIQPEATDESIFNSALFQSVTFDVDEPDEDEVITISASYTNEDIANAGANEESLRLFAHNKSTDKFETAGTNDVGDLAPTGQLGDYGITTDQKQVWAEVAELGTFIIGSIDDKNPDEPSNPSNPDTDPNDNSSDCNSNENTNSNTENSNVNENTENDNTAPAEQHPTPATNTGACGILGFIHLTMLLVGMIAMKRRR